MPVLKTRVQLVRRRHLLRLLRRLLQLGPDRRLLASRLYVLILPLALRRRLPCLLNLGQAPLLHRLLLRHLLPLYILGELFLLVARRDEQAPVRSYSFILLTGLIDFRVRLVECQFALNNRLFYD